jgi:hypothetical protein
LIAGLDVVLNQSRQLHNKKIFDAMVREGLDTVDRPGIIFDAAAIERRGLATAK